MSGDSESPNIIHITSLSAKENPTSEEKVTSLREYERLVRAASRIGGYTVEKIGIAGDRYTHTYNVDGIVRTLNYVVPEGLVIISIRNTNQPEALAELGTLALGKLYEVASNLEEYDRPE